MRVVQRLNSKIRPTTKKKEGGGLESVKPPVLKLKRRLRYDGDS